MNSVQCQVLFCEGIITELNYFDKARMYIQINVKKISIRVVQVTEWLRPRTRDLRVWDSILETPIMSGSLGQALNPNCLWPPIASSIGYLVERKMILCAWL